MPHITCKLLGPFRLNAEGVDADGAIQLELTPGSLLSEALQGICLPADVPRVVLLNGVQHDDNPRLQDDDVITVFPPIAGGCQEKIMQKLSAGTDIHTVNASLQMLGSDILISVWGGTRPHIGALAVSTPLPAQAPDEARSATVLQFCLPGHRDDVVACRISGQIASAMQSTVVVSAGIHIPNITSAGIDAVLANTDCLIKKIIAVLREPATGP